MGMTDSRSVHIGDVERDTEVGQVGRPEPTSTSLTPSGIEIAYFTEDRPNKVKRHYEIRGKTGWSDPENGTYYLGWREVPSVTTVIDKFKDPGALIWWGMRVGIEGALELHRKGVLREMKLQDGQTIMVTPERLSDGRSGLGMANLEQVEELLKRHKLTTNHVKSAAGDRGQSVHVALEEWVNGVIPDPSFYPPQKQGYIEGLMMFFDALQEGEPEVIASERMVASVEHGFAGRYDLEIRTHKPCQIVERWLPKRGPQYATLQPGLYVPDLKTSKQVYASHGVQLEGYEIGRVECGYEPSDGRGVIHVHPGDPKDDRQPDNPYYEFVQSKAKASTFIAVLNAYKELEEVGA